MGNNPDWPSNPGNPSGPRRGKKPPKNKVNEYGYFYKKHTMK